MRSKTKIFICGILALFLLLTSVLFANLNFDGETVETSGSLELSTKKIEWGIKRGDNHEQPDLGSKNEALIEKYNDPYGFLK
mgnify:CR=1 FL=1